MSAGRQQSHCGREVREDLSRPRVQARHRRVDHARRRRRPGAHRPGRPSSARLRVSLSL